MQTCLLLRKNLGIFCFSIKDQITIYCSLIHGHSGDFLMSLVGSLLKAALQKEGNSQCFIGFLQIFQDTLFFKIILELTFGVKTHVLYHPVGTEDVSEGQIKLVW